jgi:CheY-like chemotaxis protein
MTITKLTAMSKNRTDSATHARILYVEDEDVNWEVTELALGRTYSVRRARNAKEAVQLLQSHEFDLVIMDIQLSGSELDGIELTRLIRGTFKGKKPSYADLAPSQVPLIFVTAYSARYSREELLNAGGDDMVTKPVDFTKLSLALSRMLMRKVTKGSKPKDEA